MKIIISADTSSQTKRDKTVLYGQSVKHLLAIYRVPEFESLSDLPLGFPRFDVFYACKATFIRDCRKNEITRIAQFII